MQSVQSLADLLDSLSSRLSAVEARLGIQTEEAPSATRAESVEDEEDLPEFVVDFDEQVITKVNEFVAVCSKIGDKAEKLVLWTFVIQLVLNCILGISRR